MKENYVLSHNDLDGCGAIIIANILNNIIGYEANPIIAGHADEIDDIIYMDEWYIDTKRYYCNDIYYEGGEIDSMVICDILPNKDTLMYLIDKADTVTVIDHHESNEWIYSDPDLAEWAATNATIIPYIDGVGTSATQLMFNKYIDVFVEHLHPSVFKLIEEFVLSVTDVDTFSAIEKNNMKARCWNQFKFNEFRFEHLDFVHLVTRSLLNGVDLMNDIIWYNDKQMTRIEYVSMCVIEEDELLMDIVNNDVIVTVTNSLMKVGYFEHTGGIAISELGHYSITNLDLDIFISNNTKYGSISIRKNEDFNFHLGIDIAGEFGGGGHECAAGFKINYGDSPVKMVDDLFELPLDIALLDKYEYLYN